MLQKVTVTMIHLSAIRFFRLSCLAALLLIDVGCAGPDEDAIRAQREQQMRLELEEANNFLNEGAIDEAILLLEIARSEYPDQPDIVEALAFAYLSANQHDLAADLFAEVYQLDNSRTGITVFAARAYHEAGETDASIEHYSIYLKHHPADSPMWRNKATLLLEQNRRRPALDALLEALRNEESDPSAADCLQISKLFLSLGNPSQAHSWLERAEQLPLDTDQRFELKLQQFDLALRNQEWQRAANIMQVLDTDYPSQFEASPLFANRAPLEEWIANQMRVRELRITPEAATASDQPVADADADADPTPPAVAEAETEAEPATTEAEPVEATDVATTTEPADDAMEMEAATFTKIPDDEPDLPAFTLAIAEDPLPTPEPTLSARPGLMGQADLARDRGNYDEALSLYLRAAGQNDRAAAPWLEISRIYRIRGQYEDAELTALEAMRRDPQNPALMLNYLEIVQSWANAGRRLRELNAARERFPHDPDITFVVARGLERLESSPRNAIFLYQEFLARAPANHPKRADAEAALQRLR